MRRSESSAGVLKRRFSGYKKNKELKIINQLCDKGELERKKKFFF
jgi:hypothetical protein